ncbi:MTSS I-BAR domain containing 2a isoform X2 [Clupea harengus]|uniref:MTSS I-BAR domain containing 2a isoform X2 n=1 Tax=Clupea harengus TaxID=7950 RepID=A0A6P8EVT4_CLUHA|nr:MTSS I-BAR domain containing 2a isoform X2 [Clupea harengus]
MESVERECGALGGLFQAVVNDMKNSYPVWEDFTAKATKLHSQLRTTVLATAAFLDAFQKVADMATNARGATRDVGSALTRMCMRHRSIEARLRHFTNALMEKLIGPLQDKIEEWKKTAALLDKDHAKEYKRSRQEIKKKSSDTLKLQKKARKGRGGLQPQLNSAMQDVSDMYLLMEETEKQAVRRALLEERGRYCNFITMLLPVVNGEIAMLGEVTHLQAIIDDLTVLTTDPHKLPAASEQVIVDLKGSDYNWSYQTPPSSPSSLGSRKSSLCSLAHLPPGGAHRLSSVSSHDSGFISQDANNHSKPPSPMPSDITSQKSSSSASSEASEVCQSVSECNSPTAFGSSFATFRPAHSLTGSMRPLSFILPVSPHNYSPGSNTPSPTSKVPCWKDWAKSNSYDLSNAYETRAASQPRRHDPLERLRDAESPYMTRGNAGIHQEDPQRARMSPITVAPKHMKPMCSAASELAMVLTRGLSVDQQKSSRDSLQYSSGYSTQNTTPSCSEDTIPSHGSDYDSYSMNGDADVDPHTDFDKSCTVPRHSNLAQNYRRMIQTKRPASTAGLPAGIGLKVGTPPHGTTPHGTHSHPHSPSDTNGAGGHGGMVISSGTATIRRTPSSKTGVRRTPSNVGPIPIRPPIVPVKTPTVPDSPGFPPPPPETNGSQESLYVDDLPPGALDYMKASPKRLSLPTQPWGSAGGYDQSLYPPHPCSLDLQQQQHEDLLLAANRHTLVEQIGELVASAHALGDGHFLFPSQTEVAAASHNQSLREKMLVPDGEDMLKTIRRGVRLRKSECNDRSAPRITP